MIKVIPSDANINVLCSPLHRAVSTSTIIIERLTEGGLHLSTPLIYPGLMEMNFGELEGGGKDSIKDAVSQRLLQLDLQYPGGESYQKLINRLRPISDIGLKVSKENPVIIIAHSHVNLVLRAILEEVAVDKMSEFLSSMRRQKNNELWIFENGRMRLEIVEEFTEKKIPLY